MVGVFPSSQSQGLLAVVVGVKLSFPAGIYSVVPIDQPSIRSTFSELGVNSENRGLHTNQWTDDATPLMVSLIRTTCFIGMHPVHVIPFYSVRQKRKSAR